MNRTHAAQVLVPPVMIFFRPPNLGSIVTRYCSLVMYRGRTKQQPSKTVQRCVPPNRGVRVHVYMHNTRHLGTDFIRCHVFRDGGHTTAIGHEWRVVACVCVCNIRTLIHTLIPIVLRFNALLSPSACYNDSVVRRPCVSSRLISRVEFSGWTSGRTRPCPVVKIKLFGGNATRILFHRNGTDLCRQTHGQWQHIIEYTALRTHVVVIMRCIIIISFIK